VQKIKQEKRKPVGIRYPLRTEISKTNTSTRDKESLKPTKVPKLLCLLKDERASNASFVEHHIGWSIAHKSRH
jgi:hypothetical protein